jgi:hypothetical protein
MWGAWGLQRQSDLRAHDTNEYRGLRTAAISFIYRGWRRQRRGHVGLTCSLALQGAKRGKQLLEVRCDGLTPALEGVGISLGDLCVRVPKHGLGVLYGSARCDDRRGRMAQIVNVARVDSSPLEGEPAPEARVPRIA